MDQEDTKSFALKILVAGTEGEIDWSLQLLWDQWKLSLLKTILLSGD